MRRDFSRQSWVRSITLTMESVFRRGKEIDDQSRTLGEALEKISSFTCSDDRNPRDEIHEIKDIAQEALEQVHYYRDGGLIYFTEITE